MRKKNLYIHTIGCQMNVYDSELMGRVLKSLDYDEISTHKNADLIIVNTCSIREKSAEKTFSFLGRLTPIKKKNPDLIIGVAGCVAQNQGDTIIKRAPCVDIVFGTQAIGRLPEIINRFQKTRRQIVDINMPENFEEIKANEYISPENKVSKFVTIMRGCDNFCTYCVVPYVRGREISRKPENILSEIQTLSNTGTKEITLLGQNVNSFCKKEGLCSFPELLEQVSEIENIKRIRFATSHPKDLSEKLIKAFKNIKKLCNHFHLPVQSGSNHILKKMNRKYTRELYIERILKLRSVRPDISITSDIIVGFPGETREDFEKTVDLLQTVQFDGLFSFKYSDRSIAPASKYNEKIDDKTITGRLQELNKVQEIITLQKNKEMIGNIEEILVEGFSKKYHKTEILEGPDHIQWMGRTSNNKIVNFYHGKKNDKINTLTGEMIHIKIDDAFPNSLWGKVI